VSVARLTLTDFRSYAGASIAPGPGFNVLTGENGAGKTNVLEALSLLAPGRGLRGAPLPEMVRRDGEGGFTVAATLSDGPVIGTGINAEARERRIVRVDGVTASAASLAERISIVWLTPAQDRLFTDSAGARRRFLDRLVLALEPGHARHTARYEAAMRQRNRLLAERGAGRLPDPAWLDALEAAMAEHGHEIALARERLVEALGAVEVPEDSFARAAFSLDNGDVGDLRALRPRDAAAARTLSGPHRQDLLVSHAAKQMPAAQSSTGEQKALLIGIVLAHAELVAQRTGHAPVLLLDEVAAHLDARRRTALFERLAGRGQVWLTGTEASVFTDAPGARHFHVADGAISA
jgi:DNA replication and repair protein RecF